MMGLGLGLRWGRAEAKPLHLLGSGCGVSFPVEMRGMHRGLLGRQTALAVGSWPEVWLPRPGSKHCCHLPYSPGIPAYHGQPEDLLPGLESARTFCHGKWSHHQSDHVDMGRATSTLASTWRLLWVQPPLTLSCLLLFSHPGFTHSP